LRRVILANGYQDDNIEENKQEGSHSASTSLDANAEYVRKVGYTSKCDLREVAQVMDFKIH
jgi:hypothetical protein